MINLISEEDAFAQMIERQVVATAGNDSLGSQIQVSSTIRGAIISDAGQKFDIRIYPNPFFESLTIDFSNFFKEDFQIQLFDITGKEVNEKLFWITRSETRIQINTIGLPAAAYLLLI